MSAVYVIKGTGHPVKDRRKVDIRRLMISSVAGILQPRGRVQPIKYRYGPAVFGRGRTVSAAEFMKWVSVASAVETPETDRAIALHHTCPYIGGRCPVSGGVK